jgi:hypothetical protein
MKYLIKISVLFFPLILFSCFEYNSTSRQLLQILNAGPSDIARVHVGVYDGVVSLETELLRETYESGSQFPLEAPPGNNRIFLIYAEGYSGNAKYYGVTPPLTIDENDNPPIVIRMLKFSAASTFNGINLGANQSWNAIPGALLYDVIIGGIHYAYTPNTSFLYASPPTFAVRLSTSIFGIGSDSSPNF